MNWPEQTVLITGGTGSFGKKFAEIMLREYHPKRLVIFSRDELKQHDMRAAGFDQGELNRRSMCPRTWEPRPTIMRPPEYSWSWFVVYARLIGLRANATAMPVPSSRFSVCSAASNRGRNGS